MTHASVQDAPELLRLTGGWMYESQIISALLIFDEWYEINKDF